MNKEKTRMDPSFRNTCLAQFAVKGVCGPPYSLDDLDPSLSYYDEYIQIYFYDMSISVTPKDKYYEEILAGKDYYEKFKNLNEAITG